MMICDVAGHHLYRLMQEKSFPMSCLTASFGAQILQITSSSYGDIFYLSPIEVPHKSRRGGVPILFPQFAEYGKLVKHGLVRNAEWTQVTHKDNSTFKTIEYQLNIAPGDYPDWPHSAQLNYVLTLHDHRVEINFTIINTGNDSFVFTGGLHPYFAVENIFSAKVIGLEGLNAKDRYNPSFQSQIDFELTFDGSEFERLYSKAPDLELHCEDKKIKLSTQGFDQWMIWNPGKIGAEALLDLPEGDWQKFICIEPVCVENEITLEAKKCFVGRLLIEWL